MDRHTNDIWFIKKKFAIYISMVKLLDVTVKKERKAQKKSEKENLDIGKEMWTFLALLNLCLR